jgi:hypothetical protein
MKHIGFLSSGHWTPPPQSQTRSASDALLQSIELAVAAMALNTSARATARPSRARKRASASV